MGSGIETSTSAAKTFGEPSIPNETTRRLPPHVTSRPLSPHVREVIGDSETRVAFVVRADDPATQVIMEQILQPERIVEIQRKVLAGEQVPGY